MAARTARDGDAGLISQTAIELKRDLDRMGYDLHVEPYLSGGRAGASGLVIRIGRRDYNRIINGGTIVELAGRGIRHMSGNPHAHVTWDIEIYPGETVLTVYEVK